MLDIQFIRDHPDMVKDAASRKKMDATLVDQLLEADKHYRDLLTQTEQLRAERNKLTKDDQAKGVELKTKLKELEPHVKELQAKFLELQQQLPNLISEDTPDGKDETENKVIRQVGIPPELKFQPKEHWEIGAQLDIIDTERSAKVSGARFVYLKGDLALMQFALVQLVFQTLTDQKILQQIITEKNLNLRPDQFVPIVPPVLIKPEPFQKMARLNPKEERYYIPSDDSYLVGSAEHTLGAMHMDETFNENDLPLRYIGYSTAFRREAGSYGKDMKGIIRVHQFDKLEMESFCLPEDSIAEQDFFVGIQEYLLQQLKLPYQVIAICTGDMGGPDYRQIDINTWLPGQNQYRETHTADLMTDYQSRRLNTKVRRKTGETQYIHMNDATAIAIGRTLIAILENYQQADGSILIPEVLRKWIGKDKIERK